MEISGFPPELPTQFVGSAWWVYLDGPIEPDTPTRFEKYIQDRKVPPGSYIVLNSPGGNLFAGMELGRLFRKFAFSTDVGKKEPGSKQRFNMISGGCYSACAFAYLGGRFRYLKAGSIYGVHRFSFRENSKVDADIAQVTSSEIVSYIAAMGANIDLFRLSTSAAASGMKELDKKTLERLNVVNNGATTPVWTIESLQGRLYAKGERVTDISGINKFMVLCENRKVTLYAVFDAVGRGDEMMKMPVHDLMINGKPMPLRLQNREIVNGWINLFYDLNPSQIKSILRADWVGVTLRYSREAGVFLGFDGMSFAEGREKVNGVINNCR